jgi:hypothetical protein
MKIRVNLVIDLDRQKWNLIYGTGPGANAVRSDVREYVLNAVWGQPGIEESGAKVSLA